MVFLCITMSQFVYPLPPPALVNIWVVSNALDIIKKRKGHVNIFVQTFL